MTNEVVLVNEFDEPIGVMEKMEAHQKGVLHRAFSVFILNNKNEVLLHQRAKNKYHGAGLWTNACCSHPAFGEDTQESAQRRLMEEMGMDCELEKLFHFTYKSEVENGLTEHEFDHVFIGYSESIPYPDSAEVENWKWVNIPNLLKDVEHSPEQYTSWFKIALPLVLDNIEINA